MTALNHQRNIGASMASAHSDLARSTSQPNVCGLIRMAECEARYGMSRQTVRRLIHEGLIRGYRPNAHSWFLVDPKSVEDYLGLDYEKKDNSTGKVAIYCRLSAESQNKFSALANQSDMVANHAESLGHSRSEMVFYSEVCSGVTLSFTTRKQFARLWDDLKKGQIKVVVAKDSTRITRLPILDVIKRHIEDCGAKLIFVNDVDEDDAGELKEEIGVLVSYMTAICNRRSARKAGMMKKVSVDEETMAKVLSLWKQGISAVELERRCKRLGLTGTKWNGDKVTLTKSTLFRIIKARSKLTDLIRTANLEEFAGQIDTFLAKHVLISPDKKVMVPVKQVYERYVAHCKSHHLELPSSQRVFTSELLKRGYRKSKDQVWRNNSKAYMFYGITLVDA